MGPCASAHLSTMVNPALITCLLYLFLNGLLWGHGSGLESVLCGWGGGGSKSTSFRRGWVSEGRLLRLVSKQIVFLLQNYPFMS